MSHSERDPEQLPKLAIREIELPVTRAQLCAQELLFRVAIMLFADVHPGKAFDLNDVVAERLQEAARELSAKIYIGEKGGRWPGTLNGAVGVFAGSDATAVLLMTEYELTEAETSLDLPSSRWSLGDQLEMLVLHSNGSVERDPSVLSQGLIAEAPLRAVE